MIRGPGASIWGANAVNGVINIITTMPFDSLGGQVALAAGSELRGYGLARYGWSSDPDTALQVYAKAHDYGASHPIGGGDGADNWQNQSAGFKLQRLLARGILNVQGGVIRSRAGDELLLFSAPPAITLARTTQKIDSSHLMVRWEHEESETHGESFQVYLDRQDDDHILMGQHLLNLDLEYQQQRRFADKHDLIWGLGYRYSSDRIDNSAQIMVNEHERDTRMFSAYLQDEITLVPEHWRLSLGARLERNDYTGYELQPNLRLLWTPNEQNSAWLSLARAIRTPSRSERGSSAYIQADPIGVPPFVPPSLLQVVSSRMQEEHLNALDLGWRHQINTSTSIDLAAFYYRYDNLRGTVATPPTLVPPGYLLLQTQENNANSAEAHGLEAALDWRPRPNWRLQANYSWLITDSHTADLPGQFPNDYADSSPTHQFSLRSSLDLSSRLKWDFWLRHVSRIKRYAIPAHTTLDMRLAWQANKDLELSLVGQNLLDDTHPEFGSGFIRSTPSEIQRGFYAKANWTF